jgi:type IV pilus assembly protein PilC
MLELAFAIVVVGALIWILGIVAQRNNGKPIDILGFGLVGNRGLFIYANFIIAIGLCITGLVIAVKRGKLWTRPLQHALMQMPAIGGALQKIMLARIAWALHLTLNVEMDLRRIVPLVLRTTGNDYYIRHTNQIVGDVARGDPLYVAFNRSGAFPSDFIDALSVAEESGRIVESMGRLSNRYEEEAEAAVKAIAVVLGFLIAAIVMGIIVFLIFRIYGFYLGTINEAANMKLR